MADMQGIAVKLMERTNERRIPWKSTVNPNSFSAVIGNLLVMVTSQATLVTNRTSIKLAIYDEKGTELEFLQYGGDLLDENAFLAPLFQVAKRSAQGVDKRLDELMATLETGP